MMGLSVPDDMDGEVIKEIFNKEYLENNFIRYTKTDEELKDRESAELSDEERAKIETRLRDLGYRD